MSRFDRPPPPLAALPGGVTLRIPAAGDEPVPTVHAEGQPGELRVGVICNPRSHRNLQAQLADAVPTPDVVLAAPRTHGELAATLTEFAAQGVELLVIDGGDGTIRDVLTAAADAFGDALPQVAVLPNGKTNALALDLGIPLGWGLDAALAAARTGGIRRREPIVVSGASRAPLHGFLFGAGAFVRGTELAQRTHRVGAFHGVAVALAVTWAMLQTLFGRKTSEWRRGDPMRIVADGEPLADGPTYILLASTLDTLPVGLKPLGPTRSGLKALVVAAPPRRLYLGLGAILLGRRTAWLERWGYRHREIARADVRLDSDFILDGEQYPGGTLTVARGTPIAFVVP